MPPKSLMLTGIHVILKHLLVEIEIYVIIFTDKKHLSLYFINKRFFQLFGSMH